MANRCETLHLSKFDIPIQWLLNYLDNDYKHRKAKKNLKQINANDVCTVYTVVSPTDCAK